MQDMDIKKIEEVEVFKFFGLQIDSNIECTVPLGLMLLGRQKYIQQSH
jgi:hypothetical protein